MALNALDRHLVLIGFMGAGKTTLGRAVADRLDRDFYDNDAAIAESHGPIAQLFEEHGEQEFREVEADTAGIALHGRDPLVIALGGGAVTSARTRGRLG